MDLREDNSHLEKLARQKQVPISTDRGDRLARELGAVRYVECSALTQRGLKNVFDEASGVSQLITRIHLTRIRRLWLHWSHRW